VGTATGAAVGAAMVGFGAGKAYDQRQNR
jgi:hypothetical protein